MPEDGHDIRDILRKLSQRKDLTSAETAAVVDAYIDGHMTPVQLGAFVAAVRLKGEATSEIAGCAARMQERTRPVDLRKENLVDLVGTGSDKVQCFNVSTASAIVAAAAGVKIAKQVGRSLGGELGSHETLTALGVNVDVGLQTLQRCVNDAGLAFLSSTTYHSVWSRLEPPLREVAFRTIFHIAGPVTQPAGARRQIVGVQDEKLVEVVAQVIKRLGGQHAMVVCGLDGLDEITISGKTKVCELAGGTIQHYYLSPEQFGLARSQPVPVKANTPEESALMINDVLSGHPGPARDLVVMNAGAAIRVGGFASSLEKGVEVAKRTIDSGRAREVLEKVIKLTQI